MNLLFLSLVYIIQLWIPVIFSSSFSSCRRRDDRAVLSFQFGELYQVGVVQTSLVADCNYFFVTRLATSSHLWFSCFVVHSQLQRCRKFFIPAWKQYCCTKYMGGLPRSTTKFEEQTRSRTASLLLCFRFFVLHWHSLIFRYDLNS